MEQNLAVPLQYISVVPEGEVSIASLVAEITSEELEVAQMAALPKEPV